MKQSLGERLKIARGKITQTDFSAELGVSKNTYVRYERDQRIPDAELLSVICQKFNINPSWLLLGEGNKTKDSDFEPPKVQIIPEGETLRYIEDEGLDWRDKVVEVASFLLVESSNVPHFPKEQARLFKYLIMLLSRLTKDELAMVQDIIGRWIKFPTTEEIKQRGE